MTNEADAMASEAEADKRRIYAIETPKGILPWRFEDREEAMSVVMGILSWTGTPYRIIIAPKQVA